MWNSPGPEPGGESLQILITSVFKCLQPSRAHGNINLGPSANPK
jgi:hypothetical protein